MTTIQYQAINATPSRSHKNASPKNYSVETIKKLGIYKSEENLDLLLGLFHSTDIYLDVRREIVSSIGRQSNDVKILNFIKNNVFSCGFMELVYQMYRTCLYKQCKNKEFEILGKKILTYFNNEMLYKMKAFYKYKQSGGKIKTLKSRRIAKPTLLCGNNIDTLKKIKDKEIQFIFTSPPYYNARLYSDYKSYQDYLDRMHSTLKECNRVLEDGRFIIINVSPVITKRPGREFESIRYPIHFDFHNILQKAGFYFIDEIIWIKPESTVKNRNGGYQQTKMPLSYKPNCITESLMVYRKNAPFLLDNNIREFDKSFANHHEDFDTSNCWAINPKSNKDHPAVFPEELCRRVLTYYSFKTDVVLDPFAGSGTFGKVALQMGRTPVLCEVNKHYCSVIRRMQYDEL